MLDARNKIIQKNRAKIHDARDKLAQIAKRSGDARFKLLKKNINSLKKYGDVEISSILKPNPTTTKLTTKRNVPGGLSKRALSDIYKRDVDMDVDNDEYFPNLRRTVKNDLPATVYKSAGVSSMPPLPTFNKYIEPQRRMTAPTRVVPDYETDPFDCYEVPVARPYDVSEPRNLNRAVRDAQMDAYPRKGILRSSGSNGSSALAYERPMSMSSQYRDRDDGPQKRLISDENSHLSHEMRSRLRITPDVSQSMGIFSNPYAQPSREPRQVTNAGYRIVVSNLHGSVSQSDIKVNIF